MTNNVQSIQQLGQSVWYDNISRGLIRSGGLQKLIDQGVSGLTSNPTIFEKAISGGNDYDDALLALADSDKTSDETFEALAIEDIRAAADLLRPTYDACDGADGFVSLEVSPRLAYDTENTVAEARRLFAALDRPNVMIKVPATPEGIPAVRTLIGERINVNVTLIFSLETYRYVREAYIAGLEHLAHSGGDIDKVASVASFFVSRVDTAVDSLLQEKDSQGNEEVVDLLGQAAVANAKLAYRDFKATFGTERFATLPEMGARVQRPLWASTSTKNPAYNDLLYVDTLIGPDTVNTMPEATLTVFLDHGTPAETLERDIEGAERAVEALKANGVSMRQVTDTLLTDGVSSFADSYDALLENIKEKTAALLGGRRRPGSGR